MLRRETGVSCEHDRGLHACRLQGGDGLLRLLLHHIGYEDIARVGSVHRHMDDGAWLPRFFIGQVQALHEPGVSGRHAYAVYSCLHAVAADLLYVGHKGETDFLAVSILQALADWMVGVALRVGRQLQQALLGRLPTAGCRGTGFLRMMSTIRFRLSPFCMRPTPGFPSLPCALSFLAVFLEPHRRPIVGLPKLLREFRRRADFRHLEHALGQRPRLVEDHVLRPGQGFQVVGAFDQNAAGGRAADTPEET